MLLLRRTLLLLWCRATLLLLLQCCLLCDSFRFEPTEYAVGMALLVNCCE